jgi:hypothetical protein
MDYFSELFAENVIAKILRTAQIHLEQNVRTPSHLTCANDETELT